MTPRAQRRDLVPVTNGRRLDTPAGNVHPRRVVPITHLSRIYDWGVRAAPPRPAFNQAPTPSPAHVGAGRARALGLSRPHLRFRAWCARDSARYVPGLVVFALAVGVSLAFLRSSSV